MQPYLSYGEWRCSEGNVQEKALDPVMCGVTKLLALDDSVISAAIKDNIFKFLLFMDQWKVLQNAALYRYTALYLKADSDSSSKFDIDVLEHRLCGIDECRLDGPEFRAVKALIDEYKQDDINLQKLLEGIYQEVDVGFMKKIEHADENLKLWLAGDSEEEFYSLWTKLDYWRQLRTSWLDLIHPYITRHNECAPKYAEGEQTDVRGEDWRRFLLPRELNEFKALYFGFMDMGAPPEEVATSAAAKEVPKAEEGPLDKLIEDLSGIFGVQQGLEGIVFGGRPASASKRSAAAAPADSSIFTKQGQGHAAAAAAKLKAAIEADQEAQEEIAELERKIQALEAEVAASAAAAAPGAAAPAPGSSQ